MSERGLTVEWTDENSVRRRIELEPRSEGGWLRVESSYDRSDGQWREHGREIVADVTIEAAGGVVTEVGRA